MPRWLQFVVAFAVQAALLGSGTASAETCTPVRFKAGASSATIEGSAPAEGVRCYHLATGAGQTATLKVLSGKNTVFSIDGVIEAQDAVTFATQKKTYRIVVAQLMRAVQPERFRISVKVQGGKASDARSGSARVWTATSSTGRDRVDIFGTAMEGGVTLDGGCNTGMKPGLYATLHGYRGNLLHRIDDVSRPVMFVIRRADGSSRPFPAKMHYYQPEKAWVLTEPLPTAFLDEFADGESLTIQNGGADRVAEFKLSGAAEARETMRRVCRS